MSPIFISYSRDDIDFVRYLRHRLEAEGFDVWIDEARLEAGEDWWGVIEKQIEECAAFVPVMSPGSRASGWVRREILYAMRLKKPVVPVLLEGDELPILADYQYVDMRGWRKPALPGSLIDALNRVATAQAQPQERPPVTRRVPWVQGAAVLAVVTLALAITLLVLSNTKGDDGAQAETQAALTKMAYVVAVQMTTDFVGTATFSPTDTPTGTSPLHVDASPTPTATQTASPTGAPTATSTPTDTLTATPVLTDTPTATAVPTGTPTLTPTDEPPPPEVAIEQTLLAPGRRPNGIAWDGSTLWVSDQTTTLFNMEPGGRLIASYSAPDPTPEGLVWDGESLWMFATNLGNIYHLAVQNGQMVTLGSFRSPNTRIGGDLNDGLAWDGAYLWYSDAFNVYQIDRSGAVVSQFAFPKEVAGLAWDGANLWLAYNTSFEASTLVMVDTTGQILNTFSAPLQKIYAMVWADGGLWVIGQEDAFSSERAIYRLSVPEVE